MANARALGKPRGGCWLCINACLARGPFSVCLALLTSGVSFLPDFYPLDLIARGVSGSQASAGVTFTTLDIETTTSTTTTTSMTTADATNMTTGTLEPKSLGVGVVATSKVRLGPRRG